MQTAVVINSSSGLGTYTIPSWARTMKVWAIGGGGGGTTDLHSNCTRTWNGCNGGESTKTYSVIGGEIVSYVIGARGIGDDRRDSPSATAGGNTTFTYNGATIIATGGGGNTARVNGDPNCSGGVGFGGDFNRTFFWDAVIQGDPVHYGFSDFHGRLDAVAISGSVLNAGFGGEGGSLAVANGEIGGIVLCFTDDIPGVITITNIRIAESFTNGDYTFILTLGGQTECCLLKYKLIPSGTTTTTAAPETDIYLTANATCNNNIVKATVNIPVGTSQVCFKLNCGCCSECSGEICMTIPSGTTTTPPPICLGIPDLSGYLIEAMYSNTDGPCPGGHSCDRANFSLYVNQQKIMDVNLNNLCDGGDKISSSIIPPGTISQNGVFEFLLQCVASSGHQGIAMISSGPPSITGSVPSCTTTTTLPPSFSNCASACVHYFGTGSHPCDINPFCCNGCHGETPTFQLAGSLTSCDCNNCDGLGTTTPSPVNGCHDGITWLRITSPQGDIVLSDCFVSNTISLVNTECTTTTGGPTTTTTTGSPTTRPPGCPSIPADNCCDIPCKTFALNKIKNECLTDKTMTWVADLGYDKLYFKFDDNDLYVTSKNNISCFNKTILNYKSKITNDSLIDLIQECITTTTSPLTTAPPTSCLLRPSGCQNIITGLETTGVTYLRGDSSGAQMQGRLFAIGPDDVNNPSNTWVFYGENQSGLFIENESVYFSFSTGDKSVFESVTGIVENVRYLAKKTTLSFAQNTCLIPGVFPNSDYLALYCIAGTP